MPFENLSDAALFRRIQPWREFRLAAAHLFPTESSLRWFIRKHGTELVDSRSLLKLPRGTYIDPEPFRATAMRLMLDSQSSGVPHG